MFAHLAFVMQDADEWPPVALITSIAEYHQGRVGCALCLMGWTPRRELSDAEARCLELSKQIVLGLPMSWKPVSPPTSLQLCDAAEEMLVAYISSGLPSPLLRYLPNRPPASVTAH
jgi:hypothetical protein